ncbi:hypothetical protein HYALB_00010578, partial [Hymenoscyphus albidus]
EEVTGRRPTKKARPPFLLPALSIAIKTNNSNSRNSSPPQRNPRNTRTTQYLPFKMSAPAEKNDAKGKGKDTEPENTDVTMEGEDSSSDEEIVEGEPTVDEPDEDNMEEIDTENILPSRTRRRNIDFAKAAQEDGGADDEDEEEDGDFEETNEPMED